MAARLASPLPPLVRRGGKESGGGQGSARAIRVSRVLPPALVSRGARDEVSSKGGRTLGGLHRSHRPPNPFVASPFSSQHRHHQPPPTKNHTKFADAHAQPPRSLRSIAPVHTLPAFTPKPLGPFPPTYTYLWCCLLCVAAAP